MRKYGIIPIKLLISVGLISFLSGCSTRPLTDLPVRLSSSQIIDKLRCEMKRSVADAFQKKGFDRINIFYQKDLANLKRAQALVEGLEDDYNKALAQEAILKNSYEDAKLNKNTLEIRIKAKAKSDEIEKYLPQEKMSSGNLDNELKIAELQLYKAKIQLFEHHQIVENKDRELDQAIGLLTAFKNDVGSKYQKLIDFHNHYIVNSFDTLITETNDLNGEGSFAFPIHLGTFTIGVKAGDQKIRAADRDISTAINFKDLLEYECEKYPVQRDTFVPMHYPIKGNIGVDAVIKDYLRLAEKGKFSNGNTEETFLDKISFTTTLNASANPEFTITPTMRETLTAKGTIGAKREDKYEVTIGISRQKIDKPQSEKIQKVQIVESFP